MAQSLKTKIINDSTGYEVIMARVDKTLKELDNEKPSSRWSPEYWNLHLDKIIRQLGDSPVKTDYLFRLFPDKNWLIATDHVRASRGEREGPNYPVEYYSPAGLLYTGYDTSNIPHCTKNAFNRMKRGRPEQFDVLLGGFGMGPTGKSVVIWHGPSQHAIVGNIFILRTSPYYSPFVLDVFFKSIYGQTQFNRYKTGVAFNKLSNNEIEYIIVPIFEPIIVSHIESEYKKMASLHDKAMEAKKKGNNTTFRQSIDLAENMLKEIVSRMEAIISGERDDVI